MTVEDVVARHAQSLMRLPNVVDVAITEKDGREAVLVFVSQKLPLKTLPPQDVIPPIIDGYATVVRTPLSVGGD